MGLAMPVRQPIRHNPGMVRTSKGFSLPAPVGGLNAVDEFADMDPRDALVLDNFFPDAYNVYLRRGYASHVTGLPAAIESLMTWSGPSSSKMFAASDGDIYDVTSAGAVGAAVVTTLTSNRWQWTNFSTSGGNFLVLANGADSVRNYDGTTWTTPSITGVTSSTLIQVQAHKGRLWFAQKDTRDAWYLPASSISGAATKFPLGEFFTLGGKLQAMGTLSQDSGTGPDDYLCFISSKGEVLIYQGTDPASSSTWALVGRFRIGYPVGDRCTVAVGGDLIVTTSDGAISMAKMLRLDRAEAQKAAITYKIQTLFNRAVQDYGSNFGWQAILYPKGNWAVFNVPITSTQYEQYVMNIITGSWCHFTNLNAECWGLLDEAIYFGGADGVVYKADTGFTDNLGPITGNIKSAWNYLTTRGVNKRVTMIRPILQSNGSPSVLLALSADFGNAQPTGTITIGQVPAYLWDSAQWDTGQWAGASNITTRWFTTSAIGYCVSIVIKAVAQGQDLAVNSFDLQAEVGGPI